MRDILEHDIVAMCCYLIPIGKVFVRRADVSPVGDI